MPALTPAAVRQQITGRTTAPLYVLHGTDEAEKSALSMAFADIVEPELRAFNVERLYGAEASAADIVDAARTLPMMTERRVVVVLQAEKVLQPKRESEASNESVAALIAYVQAPSPTTVLVCVIGEELDSRRKLTKALVEKAVWVETGALGSGEAGRVIAEMSAARGMTIDRAAAARLTALAGGDAGRLRTDLERVLTYVGQGAVGLDDVEAVAVAGETAGDDWAVVRAIERSNAREALREVSLRLEAGDTAYALLGQIAWAVRQPRRIPAARLPAAIDAVFRTDVALKSSGGDPRVLLERLVVELCSR